MPLFIVDEPAHEYPIGGATFLFERLVRADLEKLRYLANIRGQFNDEMYDKACIAVALRGWSNLAGTDGMIPWPLELPASKISEADDAMVAGLIALTPTVTPTQRARLHGAFYVIDRLPIDVACETVKDFSLRVRELEPDAIKKRWDAGQNGSSSSATPTVDTPSTVPIADARSGEEFRVTAEA
jgi:hypothetical protein